MSLLLLALALSMDVFAAALSRGVAVRSGSTLRTALVTGLALGTAHGLMPVLGWSLGTAVTAVVRDLDHWVAFVILVAIGVRMLRGARTGAPGPVIAESDGNGGGSLLLVALATSIDAAVAGATLPGLEQGIAVACTVIGTVGFTFAVAGVYLGRIAGDAVGPRAQMIGGLILIALAIKIVIEHEFFGG
jgi:putative Mn2+ efflux pump MntP